MAKYKIKIKRSANKEIRKLPARDIKRIVSAISALADEPRPPGFQKLTPEDKYRIRVGSYRILYTVEDDVLVVYVVKVAHRRDV